MYHNDIRVRAARAQGQPYYEVLRMNGGKALIVFDEDFIADNDLFRFMVDDKMSMWVAASTEECPVCQGRGSYVNPAIDADGLTSEEVADFDDGYGGNSYLDGDYDVQCHGCHGRGTIQIPSFPPEVQDALDLATEDDAEFEAACESERRFGC